MRRFIHGAKVRSIFIYSDTTLSFAERGQASKTDVVFVSYETTTPPDEVAAFVKARRKEPQAVQREIEACVDASSKRRRWQLIILIYVSDFRSK